MPCITCLVYNRILDVGGTTTTISFSAWPDMMTSESSFHAQDTNEINRDQPFFPALHYGKSGPTCYLHGECGKNQYIKLSFRNKLECKWAIGYFAKLKSAIRSWGKKRFSLPGFWDSGLSMTGSEALFPSSLDKCGSIRRHLLNLAYLWRSQQRKYQ